LTDAVTRQLRLVDGSSSFISQPDGDVVAKAAEGFFHRDMRHLSHLVVRVDDAPLQLIASRAVDYYSARIDAIPACDEGGALDTQPRLNVRRDRFLAGGVHEDIILTNVCDEERTVRLEVTVGCDFADILECKKQPHKRGRSWSEHGERSLTLHYERDGYRRGTRITATADCLVQLDRIVFEARIEARGTWRTCLELVPLVDGVESAPRKACDSWRRPEPDMSEPLGTWMAAAPRLETSWDGLRHIYERSLYDLASLRFRPLEGAESVPAGGLPWFMALFGRDSMIASYQALPFKPDLARATLRCLAALQADSTDDFRDSEPGKILHELRFGELATLGLLPHSPYYGAHDTTPLFCVLLDEYERWTGDGDLVRELEPNVRRALAWIETHGDPNGDGYLEYERRSPKGLENQCWKDSWNSVLDSAGREAELPIAICEVQGYAYDARMRCARLARAFWGDEPLAARLESEAAALRERFDRDYWCEERGHFALALDGRGRRVDALTSNIGHLLWSGIVLEGRAARVGETLLSDELWTGWGIRTMSSGDGGYNPIEYHNGTVWPHDTAIAAEGLRRYGLRDEATRVAVGMLEAAEAFGSRLPELFAGLVRDSTNLPAEYPEASEPQAFASGAPLMALRTLLGLDAEAGRVHSDPHLPAGLELTLEC